MKRPSMAVSGVSCPYLETLDIRASMWIRNMYCQEVTADKFFDYTIQMKMNIDTFLIACWVWLNLF